MLIEINSAFAAMAADPPSCAAFVAEAVALARDSGFHGLHVACQFPACAVDIANFAFLICGVGCHTALPSSCSALCRYARTVYISTVLIKPS